MKAKPYITVKNLSCSRNYMNVFRNVSLTVYPKSYLIIKGRNGSGKTSLLLGLAGHLSIQGYIKWSRELTSIGYVGHKTALKENEKVDDYINFWKLFYRSKWNKDDIINLFSLKKIIDLPTSLLSYGQKKLLSFIRLNMLKSKVWLLDEPLSGLDYTNKQLILKMIEIHNKNGGATVMTTHDDTYLIRKAKHKEIIID